MTISSLIKFLLKYLIKSFSPQILHAHYASSYGLLAYFLRFKPFVLSVWGSDLYYFPKQNIVNKYIIQKVINSADHICSTSNAMKEIIIKDFNRSDCSLVPFGIDVNKFYPKNINSNNFTVGTIKSIESHNGIDCLISAADIIINKLKFLDINFIVVGKGNLLQNMKLKVKKLKLEKNIKFFGHVPHNKTINYFQKLSIFIAVSTRESFGVSILEAGSCEVPAITSDVGGLPEVNIDKKTGFVIGPKDPEILAQKIIYLYKNEVLRKKMGKNARERIITQFNWTKNVRQMLKIYKKVI